EVASEETLRIAYIQTGPYEYYQFGADGAQLAAAELGIELILFDSELSPEKEIANVEDAIQQGVDGIVLFSVGRASEEAALALTDEAGIPAALLYGYAPELEEQGAAFLQADVNTTGRLAGEWVAENVEAGQVAIIQGALGRGDAEAYTESFKVGLANNSNLEVVAEPEGAWDRGKAVAAMEDILTRYPDLAAVFVHNEDMALGAITVIKDQG
ncbi:MAG: sugar ABC transporter substrate-binding protein, partial [Gammaproteobacteria bacterium]|nr:sugar ABC transporter substrate-binding protein [Gammaproteobacteria bacterium]